MRVTAGVPLENSGTPSASESTSLVELLGCCVGMADTSPGIGPNPPRRALLGDFLGDFADATSTPMAWAAAERVLRQQAQLHARLRDFLASYPQSGLYDDEAADAAGSAPPAAFGAFVAHVRQALTSSARTVLLRDLDARFAALPSAPELCEILCLGDHAPIARVAAALGRADGGRAYRQWEAAATLAPKPVLARDAHIRAIGEGMAAKAKRRGDPPPRDAEIVAAVDAAIAAANAARAAAAARADELRTNALADDDHARWARARHLWDDGGGRALWSSYQSLSVSDGDERRERGSAFEEGHAELSFRIAVLRIEGARSCHVAARVVLCWPAVHRGRVCGGSADGPSTWRLFVRARRHVARRTRPPRGRDRPGGPLPSTCQRRRWRRWL